MRFLIYSLVRLALFLVVFLPLALFGWNVWLAGAVGLIVAFCISYLFLNRLRLGAAEDVRTFLARRRGSGPGRVEAEDAAAEDSAADRRADQQ